MDPGIALSLNAVIVVVTEDRPRILTVLRDEGPAAIPSGPLDPKRDATLELGLRRWISSQTGLDVGYVEQLYTFGDRGRQRGHSSRRLLSVGYLALMREAHPSHGAAWIDWHELFPWEDHREGVPALLRNRVLPSLHAWADGSRDRLGRIRVTFGEEPAPWDPIRVLERYELLYDAGLVEEAFRDREQDPPANLATGRELAYDHRRIAATALSRLRGKLTYRPVVFELLGGTFTLTQLQHTVEAVVGQRLHKQNFRRLLQRGRLVEGTRSYSESTGGRPAELFRFRDDIVRERPRPGVSLPRLR
jgi:hypothetical protein